jgi:3-deoxy-7-phosphoheptulonate synthase
MIIVLRQGATPAQIRHIEDRIREWGLVPHVSQGSERTVIGVIGDEDLIRSRPLDMLPGVESVKSILKPYRLANAATRPGRTVLSIPAVRAGGEPVEIGGDRVVMIAGPCSVESREQLFEIAACVREHGGAVLRAGAFKPRTSPYSFQGLGFAGLDLLAEARERFELPIVTVVMDTRDLERVAQVADIIQIGARNMQNFNLLKMAGTCGRPILLKRGLAATLEELLMSAEYVLSAGNPQVLLCERGIRTFEPMTRNTLDLSAVPVLRRETHLPIAVDPSHGTGHWDLVAPMALAAVAAGADALTVEIHPRPEDALSDGSQALLPSSFAGLMERLDGVARAVGRTMRKLP